MALFQHFALLSFLFAIAGVAVILKTYGHDRSRSISSHAAGQRTSYWLFLASITAAVVSFYAFTLFWLLPVVEISGITAAFIALALLLLIATAIIPDSGGKKSLWHGIVAWSMAVLLLLVVIGLLLSQVLSPLSQGIVFLVVLYMIVDWLLFLFIKKTHQHFLLFQSTYVLSFYIAMLATAYLR